ncbi:adenosine 5'-monophosphoramidase HINT3-like [Saccoglossus kowalevskii]|uniref:Adenosine 5'-monophosphoramidase HINT3 n=1 Tax=Saccoglossus kowalevskii TaxID=10224 RepID=A0ABM0MNT1_SACKO|nr:PREDICTED: histidine triad nucleotide-binding protein 3-like [Saccoglossus kowalevskii]
MGDTSWIVKTPEQIEERERKQKAHDKLVESCVFCNIAFRNDLRADILYKDSKYVVFRDIRPSAKEHYLVVTKKHIKNLKQLSYDDIPMIENMIDVAKATLVKNEADPDNARIGFHLPPLVSVDHLHMHVIAPADKIGFFGRLMFRPDSYWFLTVETFLEQLRAKESEFWGSEKMMSNWYVEPYMR